MSGEPQATGCECATPGFCERHQCDKTARFHEMCSTRPEWFATWEAGQGPCTGRNRDDPNIKLTEKKAPGKSRGLGDTIANITHATGIAQAVEFVSQLTGVPCGCAGRQEALNKLVPYNTNTPPQ